MKYVVDMDALMDCLDCLENWGIGDQKAVYLDAVKLLIDKFPKDKLEEKPKSDVLWRENTR